ncbi:bifunctional serine/threonine-protein kinase/glutamate ABC transporter substrate-binding protein [Streptomyces sp. 71268]|uniref:bifunctional serine/threonine-protein kinase/glutamate ABC transporter substrate-binding protein n=1 Tax=Streptomyces sp. 71268 TaxID=3002640 RepID=UPI0023F70215|nr:bifunctional serine/threonine-protein kinase/glutamate ABC transporter substrate-binding protein [Streptomyces sp. 71268]WEV29812.1 bifunctional serine/threonine-protein kinase/glutamate ABC transporter substrate-binding protein [Streptomyces sp. 71268]
MGTVWRARDLALDRDVALKEVRPQDPALAEHDPEGARQLRARVLREARALARISHPNVATIHHIVDGAEHPYPWLVMELVPGENVADRLTRGTLSPAEAARLGRGVLAGLVAVHAADIQHRDVKPANVLVRPDGRPVLTDFGIAAIQGSTVLTAAGSLIGTPEYMAPERAAGQDGDATADLWSLGMLLYVAVEGRHPLRRANTLATLAAIVGQDVPPPTRAGALTEPLRALLVRRPQDRPDAATLDRLLAAAESPPASARTESAPDDAADGQPALTTPVADRQAPTEPPTPAPAPPPAAPSGDYHLPPPAPQPVRPAQPAFLAPAPLPAPPQGPPPGARDRRPRRSALYAATAGALAIAGLIAWNVLPNDASDKDPGKGDDRSSQSREPTPDPNAPAGESPVGAGADKGTGKKITIGIKSDQPGISARRPDGDYAGLDVDVATYVAKALGHTPADIVWKEVSSADRETVLEEGKADLVVATYAITAEREKRVDFAGPYLTGHQDALVSAGDLSVRKPENLHDKRICALLGSTTSLRLRTRIAPQAQIVEHDSYEGCIDALARNSVDAVVSDDVILAGYAAQQPGAFRLAGLDLSNDPYGIGLPKGSPLTGKVDKALKQMVDDGSWDRAVRKNVPLLGR